MKFRVAAVSSNANSFGLHQVIFIAQDGTALKALKTTQFIPKKGDDVELKDGKFLESLSRLGYEVPEEIEEKPPTGVVEEVWGH